MIKKKPNGWLVDIRPQGRNGPRYRKTLSTKAEAIRFEAFIKSQAVQGNPWNSSPKDKRRLSELCNLWYRLHGVNLRDGKGRLAMLLNLCSAMGDPFAFKFTAKQFSHYRESRLSSVSPNTVNHEQAYLRAVFNELSRLGEWSGNNPLISLRMLKCRETELRYLTTKEIAGLLAELQNCQRLDAYHV
ncbi:MAG: integrase, partial [Gammaproteobacteria bacterium]|nr:integrase [Gammaproteobacteria bacterium]